MLQNYLKQVPVLPNIVDIEYVKTAIDGVKNVPIGVNKKSLTITTVNLANKAMLLRKLKSTMP